MSRAPVLAMLVLGALAASCAGSNANSFEIVRDGQNQSYGTTSVELKDEGPQLVLYASSSRDDPSIADDERWYYLWIVFDAVALADLATGQDDPISGEGSWTRSERSGVVRPEELTFTGKGLHTATIEEMFFRHCRGGCWINLDGGVQTIQGNLHLTVNDAPRLAGVIEVRVEGDVPGIDGTYDLTLRFDQTSSIDAGTDAGIDAGTDAGPDAGTDAGPDAGTP